MTQNVNISISVLFRFCTMEIFAFCVITFEPIEVQTCSAPQNDPLNLSFVDDIYVDGGKLARNGGKTAILASG